MTTTFETAKVGDRVWGIEDRKWHMFTADGKFSAKVCQTLFWDEIPIVAPTKPLPKLEVDTKVLVWNIEGKAKQKRYFSHFDENGIIYCFADGRTRWSKYDELPVEWENWELADGE
jgi:hypothetical protein